MEQTTINIRINLDDKNNFKKFCCNTGLDISTAINLFIKTVLREKKIPFEIKDIGEENNYPQKCE